MRLRGLLFLFVVSSFAPFAHAGHLDGLAELILSGHAKEARSRLRAAASACRKESDAKHEGIALLLLAFADIELDDVAASKADLQQSAAKSIAAGDHYTAWYALLCAAGLEIREANWAAAVPRLGAALERLRLAANTPLSLEGILSLGPMFGMDYGPLGPLLDVRGARPARQGGERARARAEGLVRIHGTLRSLDRSGR